MIAKCNFAELYRRDAFAIRQSTSDAEELYYIVKNHPQHLKRYCFRLYRLYRFPDHTSNSCERVKNAGRVWRTLDGLPREDSASRKPGRAPRAREVSRLINRNGVQHKLSQLRGVCGRIFSVLGPGPGSCTRSGERRFSHHPVGSAGHVGLNSIGDVGSVTGKRSRAIRTSGIIFDANGTSGNKYRECRDIGARCVTGLRPAYGSIYQRPPNRPGISVISPPFGKN